METKTNPDSRSHVSIDAKENGPSEPYLLVNREQAIFGRLQANISWGQLVHDLLFSVGELQKEFEAHIQQVILPQSIAYEPFSLTLSFWQKGKFRAQAKEKSTPTEKQGFADTSKQLFSRAERLLNKIRKTHLNNKADMLLIAFEWLETHDSAPVKDVVAVMDRNKLSPNG